MVSYERGTPVSGPEYPCISPGYPRISEVPLVSEDPCIGEVLLYQVMYQDRYYLPARQLTLPLQGYLAHKKLPRPEEHHTTLSI